MTPREPDRYEEKARELLREIRHGVLNMEQAALHLAKVAATLRAEHDDALERAAQGCAEKGRDYERRAAGQYEHGSADEAGYLAQRASAWRDAESLCRALASPAAAPAAETDPREDRWANPDLGPMPEFAPPSEPAAPAKYDKWAATRGIAAPPAPLLPRVLAALEQEASAHDDFDSTYEHAAALALRALAAELRAYIAERDDLLRECEEAIRDSFLQFDGRRFKALLPKLAARAARAKGEGT